MLKSAFEQGLITKDSTIIEPTSGNTGIGLAFCCASMGLKCILTMPSSMSEERKKLLSALGATLVLTPSSEGMKGAIAKAEELKQSIDGAFIPQQFENEANPLSHESTASVINGIPTGATGISSTYDTTIADFGSKLFTAVLTASYDTNSFGSTFPTQTAEIRNVTKKSRFCFFPESTFTMSGITNNEVAFYIDNIRISIVSENEE
jgi:hypothetical protein